MSPAQILDRIPEVRLERLLNGRDFKLIACYPNHIDGAGVDNNAYALAKLALNYGAKAVLEIGTFRGHTTTVLAQNLPLARIYTIDLPPGYDERDPSLLPKDDFHLIRVRKPGMEYLGKPGAERIVQLYGDTATYDFAGIDRVSFAFIDGSHTYAYCENDSRKCYEIMSGGGAIAWHDCDERHPGVLQLLNEWVNLGRRIVRIQDTCLAYWEFKLL